MFNTDELYAALAEQGRSAEELAAEFTKALNEASKKRSEELRKDKEDQEKRNEISNIIEALASFCEKYYSVTMSKAERKSWAEELLNGFELISKVQKCSSHLVSDDKIIEDFLRTIM